MNCCQKRGGTRFSLDKLFAYQLTLVKGKNIPNAICSQSGAGVGPRASCSSGSQTQFQNPRQLPPGLFWEAAQLRGTPAFEAFPVTLKPFAHPAGAASSFSGPGRLPVQPTVITLLPVSAAASAGIRFLGMEGESGAESGEQTWGGLLSPLHPPASFLGSRFPHPPPGTRPPRRHPAPGLTPSSFSSQGWPLSLCGC